MVIYKAKSAGNHITSSMPFPNGNDDGMMKTDESKQKFEVVNDYAIQVLSGHG